MIRRLLTTLLAVAALGACGLPEDGEWPEDGVWQQEQALVADPVVEQETRGREAGVPTLVVLEDGSLAIRPITLVAAGGGAGDPGGTVSSTQDPIPAKSPRDPRDPYSHGK